MEEKKDKELDRQERKKKRQKDADQKAKSWIREWLDALIFAFIAAAILRTFLFGSYRIPTPSMEKNLMVNDFLIVSNLTYGPRTPMSLCIPFVEVCVPGVSLPWTRLPGFRDVERYDVIVFNYPIEVKPISQKTNYIKRAVGIPGDTLEIIDKIVYVNGEREPVHEGMQHFYRVKVKERVRLSAEKVKVAGGKINGIYNDSTYRVNMTRQVAEKMRTWTEVDTLFMDVMPEGEIAQGYSGRFSFSSRGVNPDQMDPIVVPFEGQTVTLTDENWHLYRNIVERYEENTVQKNGDNFIINGVETNQYTIQQDYFFAMGDNRDNSEDSRFYGFVPHDHLIGHASFVWFSWDSERFLPRFDRIFYIID